MTEKVCKKDLYVCSYKPIALACPVRLAGLSHGLYGVTVVPTTEPVSSSR